MSGNPAIMGETRMEVCTVIVSSLFLIMLAARRKIFPTGRCAVVLFVWTGIFVIQCITFDFWPFSTMIGFMLRLFIGYAAVRLVEEFPRKYVEVMFYTCLVSLFFHLFTIAHETMGIDLIKYFAPLNKIANPYRGFHIFIHNFLTYGEDAKVLQSTRLGFLTPFRNSSYFWEPGVFAAYILLAIVLLGMTKDKFDEQRRRNTLTVLVVGLLTTMSTTGYILLPLCWLFHLRGMPLTAKLGPKMLRFILILGPFCAVAFQLDFVGPKILDHRDKVAYHEPGWHRTRFGAIVFDYEYIRGRPLFGWGPNLTTRYMLHGGESMGAMGNGLSDFTVKFGLSGLTSCLACIFVGAYRLTNGDWKTSILFVFFVAMVLNGEHLLDYSLYLGLMFVEPIAFTTYRSPRGRQLQDMNEIGVRRFSMGKCGVHFL